MPQVPRHRHRPYLIMDASLKEGYMTTTANTRHLGCPNVDQSGIPCGKQWSAKVANPIKCPRCGKPPKGNAWILITS